MGLTFLPQTNVGPCRLKVCKKSNFQEPLTFLGSLQKWRRLVPLGPPAVAPMGQQHVVVVVLVVVCSSVLVCLQWSK